LKEAKRRFTKPVVFITLLFQLIVSFAICVMLVFYSPFFNTIKKFVVSSAMQSGTHQWIAEIFYNQAQIDEITSDNNNTGGSDQQSLVGPTFTNTGDSTINEYHVSGSHFSGYILEIKDRLKVKVAMTQTVGRKGELTSAIAKRFDAIAAINGGGFVPGAKESDGGKTPSNFVIHNGNVVFQDKSWGDDDKVNVIALDNNGTLIVDEHSINELKKLNVSEAVTMNNFKPLIVNGKGRYKKGSDVSRAPRTSIAQRKDGTILLIALNGRQVTESGATFYEEQQMLLDNFSSTNNPVITATSLDGGGSTTMYYNGDIINEPTAQFGERPVATAFYVEK
jgi:exopolysaccharide biosynthesis protein